MKTPEEIKKGLECCYTALKDPYFACKGCPYGDMRVCDGDMGLDALAYIQQLERERDAMFRDLQRKSFGCDKCKHYLVKSRQLCALPLSERNHEFRCWEWRGMEVDG